MPASPASMPSNLKASGLPTRALTLTGLSGRPVAANVTVIGRGRSVLFLNGLVGLNEHWEEVAWRVSERLRCHLLELPLLALRGPDCSIAGVTALTTRFVERELSEPPIVVGNSFGGHVALRIALDRPELVRALVLAGSSGLLERTLVRELELRPSRRWVEERIAELFYDRSKMRRSDVDRAHAALTDRENARALVRLSRTARRNHLGEQVRRVRCPVLLIWGRDDVITPPEAAEQFLSLLPDARITWLDRCGHAPMIEWPEEFGEALLGFAEELERGGAGAGQGPGPDGDG